MSEDQNQVLKAAENLTLEPQLWVERYADFLYKYAVVRVNDDEIAKDLKQNNINVKSDKEIIALIAYLQRMGTDIKANRMTIPSNQ